MSKGQKLVVDCEACGVVSRLDANDTAFPYKMELEIAARLMFCPNCNARNGYDDSKLKLRADVH